MKFIHVILLAFAFFVSNTVYAYTSEQSEAKSTVISETTEPKPIEITAYDNRIKVINAPVGSTLEIYSVVGIKVKEIKIKQSTAEYMVDIAKGYYIIRIDDTVRKIAIR